jgi:beta-glucanase (GH16 family)/glycerophosphoryl diester phosphodiesterase
MRLIFPLFIAASLLSGSISAHVPDKGSGFADNPVVAHRGAWKSKALPQNSIASLKHAIELRCTGSEFDVRLTADDSLVINHDPDYNKLPIEKSSYAALTAFRLANGEKLPTLREYIRAGLENNKHTRLVCEIKPSDIGKERGKTLAEKVVRMVNALNAQQMVVYISFDYDILKRIVELNPKANTQYLEGDRSPEQLKMDGISGADFHYSVYMGHPEWIESARQNHIALNAWTVNESAEMDWLLANGFDFITTNEPELLLERMKQSPPAKGWKLMWSDEFSYNGLPDSTKWEYEVGGHGWGNNEMQYYTAKDTLNAKTENGLLKITARHQAKDDKQYTSARLLTRNKSEFTYGRFEIRARLPAGRGTWPAIWMLGTNIDKAGWPLCGEIDIMEHVGYEKDSIFGTIHSEAYNHIKGTQKGKAIFIEKPYDEFHVYSMEWTPEQIDFLVDGQVFNHIANEHKTVNEWPFDQPFFLILNLAVGGNWGGRYGVDESVFPAELQVDYVRVFKK